VNNKIKIAQCFASLQGQAEQNLHTQLFLGANFYKDPDENFKPGKLYHIAQLSSYKVYS